MVLKDRSLSNGEGGMRPKASYDEGTHDPEGS